MQITANAAAALLATKLLPAEDRGIMVLGLTIAALVSIVCAGGIGNVLRGEWAAAQLVDRPALAVAYGSLTLWTVGAGFVVAVGATAVFGATVEPKLSDVLILLATGTATASQVLLLQVTEAFFADARFRAGSSWAAIAAVAGLVAVLAVGVFHPTAPMMMAGQGIGTLVVSVLALVRVRSVGTMAFVGWVPKYGRLRLMRRGAASMGLPIGMALLTRADRLVLGFFVAPSVIAVYALAATIAEGIRLAPTALAQIATHHAASGHGWKASLRLQRAALGVSAAVAVPGVILAWITIVPFFGEPFRSAPFLLAILAVSELGYAILVVGTRGMVGAGWLAEASKISGLTGLASIAAYAVGAMTFGVVGCCVARVAVMACAGLWATGVLRSRYSPAARRISAEFRPRHSSTQLPIPKAKSSSRENIT